MGQEKFLQPNMEYKVEVVQSISEEDLTKLKKLDDSVMPEQMRYDVEDLRECFDSKEGVHILVRDAGGDIVGYLTAIPKNDEYEGLHEEDADFNKDDFSLYIESVLIKDGDFKTAKQVFDFILEEARKRGYKNISMHTRVSQGLSEILQKRYGAKFFRRIEDWYGFGEAFDYLELDILDK